MKKILLDTDIGSDIDDSVCLAYLLAQPDCELLGITTVTGEAGKRAMMADALCGVADREIPIFPGLENPLLLPIRQTHAPQFAAAEKWLRRRDFPTGQAIDFLRQTIRQHPHEVTLLAIGPLTNIAALLTIDPEIAPLLKALVLMGGNYTPVRWKQAGPVPIEWNILNDPHAAAIVFRAGIPLVRAIGLDVTTQVTMPGEEVRHRFQHKLLRPVLDFAEIWFRDAQPVITFHDPLAATTIFDNQICAFQPGTIEIELTSPRIAGFTYWTAATNPLKHQVASSVDAAKFFDHYFSQFRYSFSVVAFDFAPCRGQTFSKFSYIYRRLK
jgi:purine nucleosidase